MEDSDVALITNGSAADVIKICRSFSQRHVRTFEFAELNKEEKRRRLWGGLFQRLQIDRTNKDVSMSCLGCVRILSRDKTGLNDVMQESWISCLLLLAGLTLGAEVENASNLDEEVMLEAAKCLSNLIFNSDVVQAWCAAPSNPCLASLVRRLRQHPSMPHQIQLFDIKLLFLVTAVCQETRLRVRQEERGMTRLTEALEQLLPPSEDSAELSEENAVLICELLKVAFNIADGSRERPDEEEEAQFTNQLVPGIRRLLLLNSHSQLDLHSHCVNVLMAIPPSCYSALLPPITSASSDEPQLDMRALDCILNILKQRLSESSPENGSGVECSMERLCPVLTVLASGALENRPFRKHVRSQVLPPLREVHTRPEEGGSLRNALCRLLTCPVTVVRDLVAELLFILCKESVSRMVKHTGYGNCAGLLANRGLMLGGRGDHGHYSSESEDSDTEEYRTHRDRINPVIGCCEPSRPDPLANISEEQKEYEAMQLANMMDRLTRGGVVQPCRIGEDGRPEPVEHILQLQQGLPRPPRTADDSDSD